MILLEQGDSVRYQGLGAGRVIRHERRQFQGQERLFAVIELPHRDMTVQLPVGDLEVTAKLTKVLSKTQCRRLITSLKERGPVLARTWDQRAENGAVVLKSGGPEEWALLLRAYASARSQGLAMAASDAEILRSSLEMLAAELAAASDILYDECFAEVERHYRRAAADVSVSKSAGESTATVESKLVLQAA